MLTNLLTFFQGYGTAHQAAELHFLPLAVKAAEYGRLWSDSPAVDLVSSVTETLLWQRNAGAVIAKIEIPDDGFTVSGNVEISYLVDGVETPLNVMLTVDGSTLVDDSNVAPGNYLYTWDSAPYHDGQAHTLELVVEDNNGVSAKDIIGLVVGSPSVGYVEPSISLLGPDNDLAFRYFKIEWSDFDPDDNAIISLGYDPMGTRCNESDLKVLRFKKSKVGLVKIGIQISGIGGTCQRNSGASYWIYAIIEDDLHDPVCVRSPGTLTIEIPTNSDNFDFDSYFVDDTDEGNGNGIWGSRRKSRT